MIVPNIPQHDPARCHRHQPNGAPRMPHTIQQTRRIHHSACRHAPPCVSPRPPASPPPPSAAASAGRCPPPAGARATIAASPLLCRVSGCAPSCARWALVAPRALRRPAFASSPLGPGRPARALRILAFASSLTVVTLAISPFHQASLEGHRVRGAALGCACHGKPFYSFIRFVSYCMSAHSNNS